MSQISFGTITIVDTTDIQRFYVEYAKSNSSAAAPTTGWSQNRPTWQNGTYIWQRTVIKKQDVAQLEYGSPVCITGEKGQTGQQGIQGNTGKGISSIVTTYCNYGTGTPAANYSGWNSSVPEYDKNKPNYWVKTTINYTTGNPSVTIYKDLGITEAAQKANLAASVAQTAESNSVEAISIAGSKNKIYYSTSFPINGDYINGDTLFYKTSNGTIMYVYDNTYSDNTSGHWRQQQFEENAISDLAITNAKIKNLSGDKITANTIASDKIVSHSITATQLATDAIKSTNYRAGTAPYSTAGTFLDLANGNIYSQNFGINNVAEDNIEDGAYIKGSIYAYNGTIGSSGTNYWYIGDYYDYNQDPSAYIKGHGTATIQLGNTNTWRLNTNRIHTAWNDDATNDDAYLLHYPVYSSKYWDLGFHLPTSTSDKFIYIRNSSSNSLLENLQNSLNDNLDGTNNQWNYQFYITSDGSVYAKNIYIVDENGNTTQIGGTDGVYLLKSGGTITGNLTVNGTLTATASQANALTHTLSINGQSWTGSSNLTINTLGTAYGGTGNTSYTTGGVVYVDGSNPKKLLSTAAGTSGYLLQSGGAGAPTWVNPATLTVAAADKATKDGDGNVIKTTYLKLTGGNITGPVSFGDSVSIDDLNTGTLVVTGNASFTNNIQANTINGVTVGSSPKFTDTTYTFDNGYNASSNKGATVLTVTNAINALNVNPINGATNKTLTSISETAGKISATYSNISITKSQVSDFPTSMPASDVSAWAKASTKPSYKQNEILPLLSKTFTDVIGTENNWANAVFFFGSIKPTSWNEYWRIKYKIRVYVPGQPNYNQMADVLVSGRANVLRSYYSFNTIGAYYVCYYHELYRMKEAGFNSGYGHALGVRFYSAYVPTDTNYKRTIEVEILETENCTFSFYDNCLTYANIPGTGTTNYDGYSEMDFVNNGLQETGDSNDVNYYNRTYYTSRTTSAALYRYQICLTKSDGTLVPVNSVNNTVATNKTLTIDSFDPFGEIFYWNTTSTASANANVGNGALYRQYLADLRYSFNCGGYDTTPTLTARMPLYLVATPQADGTAKLYVEPLSMYLPSSEDGLIYIYLGRVYEDSKPYRVVLSLNHPIYEYRNGAVRLYTGLKSETAASGGTNVSLVTTGQKYLWNSKTNNTGTVTSVAASGSGGITISGSPITTSGTLAIGLNLSTAINGLGEGTSAANRNDYAVVQYAGGGTSTTSYHRRKLSNVFKALIADDIPNLAWSKITSGNDDLKAIEALEGTSGLLKKTAANTWTLDTSAYVTSSGVTSITLTQGTGISIGSSGTAITSTGTRTISLADNYGDTKNPYASKTARYVLAAPAAANGVPSFRALTNSDVGLGNVLNIKQVTGIGQGDNGKIRVFKGTGTNDYEDIAVEIVATSTSSVASAQKLSSYGGSATQPIYIPADGTNAGKPVAISYTIEKSVPSNAVFTDTWNKVSTSQDGYVTKLPGNTTTFLRGDGSWGTPIGTTYTFDGTYNASSNKAATVSTVTNAINALDGNLNNTTPGAGKTLTAFSQTDGKISATFGDISITKSQISDFPSTLTPAAHTHGNISNTGTITSTAVALGNGDNLLFADSSNSGKIERSSITIGTGTSKYLRQDGTWGTPAGTYSLPVATDSVRGGVKIGYSGSGKNYAVQLSSEKMYVNVPWTDTTYSAGTGLSLSGTTFNHSNSITAGTAGTSSATSSTNRTIAIPYVTYDAQGHITASGTHTHTLDSFPEAYLAWGGQNFSGSYGPIDAAMVPELGANRFAFLKAEGLQIDYSTDAGATWASYGATDIQKIDLFANGGSFYLGKATAKANNNINNQLRIIITTNLVNLYTVLNKIIIYMSTNGNTTQVKIERATKAAPDNYILHLDWTGLSGWSGWNVLNISGLTTYGNTDSQYQKIKITFRQTTVNSNYPSPAIWNIKGFGGVGWATPSTMAKTGHLYSYDGNQNATFPAQITATQFNGKLNGNATTATNATSASRLSQNTEITYGWSGLNYFNIYAANQSSVGVNDTPFTSSHWTHILRFNHNNSSGYYTDLAIPFDQNSIYYKRINAGTLQNSSTNGGWVKVLDQLNYIDYTVKKDGTGATGSWGISITGNAANVTGTVAVGHGGTGATSFTSGALLIGNGTGAVGTRTIKNMTSKGNLGWTSQTTDVYIPTVNTLAYWDGRFNSTSSNLTYCTKGAFGDAVTKGVVTTLDTSVNLPTAGAVSTALGSYVTLTTEQTISGRKTFENLVTATFKGNTGSEYCNINYNQTLGALVFSFG